MEIVFDIGSAFQLIADEKACAFLEKNFSKCLIDLRKEIKKTKNQKKGKKQELAEIKPLSKELVYQWRLLILAVFSWLFEYGEPPLKDGEGWKALNWIKVSKSEDSENLESEESESDESESEESYTIAPITAIRIRITSTLLYQFVEGRLTPEKVFFILKAKKTIKGIEFLFEMARDTARDDKILLRRIALGKFLGKHQKMLDGI